MSKLGIDSLNSRRLLTLFLYYALIRILPANQPRGKKGDKKKGDESKSEDKGSNTGGTTSVHVEDTTTTEKSTVPNEAPSIGTHASETNV